MDRKKAKDYWNAAVVGDKFPTHAPDACPQCGTSLATGTVMLVFGEVDSVIAQHDYADLTCGMKLIGMGRKPQGALLFVEREHRSMAFDQLPLDIHDNVLAGFDALDRLSRLSTAASEESIREMADKASDAG